MQFKRGEGHLVWKSKWWWKPDDIDWSESTIHFPKSSKLFQTKKVISESNSALYLVACYRVVQAVRSAAVRSPLSADSLFARSDQPLRVSLGFRSSSSDGTVLRSSHQVPTHCKSNSDIQFTGEKQGNRSRPAWSLIACRASPPSKTSSCPCLMDLRWWKVIITPWGQTQGAMMESGITCLQ